LESVEGLLRGERARAAHTEAVEPPLELGRVDAYLCADSERRQVVAMISRRTVRSLIRDWSAVSATVKS
jgi:hypothetical protein